METNAKCRPTPFSSEDVVSVNLSTSSYIFVVSVAPGFVSDKFRHSDSMLKMSANMPLLVFLLQYLVYVHYTATAMSGSILDFFVNIFNTNVDVYAFDNRSIGAWNALLDDQVLAPTIYAL